MSAVAPENPKRFGSQSRRSNSEHGGQALPGPGEDASFSDLVSTALAQVRSLLRSEVDLVRTEIAIKATAGAGGLAMVAGAAVFALSTVTLLLATIAALLAALGMPVAAALLIATLCGAVAAGALGWLGLQRLSVDALKPKRSIAQLHNDATMIKEQVR